MVRRLLPCCLLLALAPSPPASAQDDAASLDSIEVTGSRISYRDLLDTPAITITKPGDYLLQTLTLVNDTRQEEGRRQEIHQTIEKLVARAGTRYQVLHGESYRTVLGKSGFRIELEADSKRPDVSRVELHVRARVDGPKEQGEQLIKELREFVQQTAGVGRTEIDLDPETALGMNRPERYRHELIAAIAEDSRKVVAGLGSGCEVAMEGLNSRIEWERVGAVELLLYVPYTMTVSGCVADAAR